MGNVNRLFRTKQNVFRLASYLNLKSKRLDGTLKGYQYGVKAAVLYALVSDMCDNMTVYIPKDMYTLEVKNND
jgi:hypothetical protein